MTTTDILKSNPDLFWAFIYFSWGASYSALISTGVVLATVLKKLKATSTTEHRRYVYPLQVLWSLLHLPAVFAYPILIGLISRDALIQGRYAWLIAIGLVAGVLSLYLIAKPIWRFKDMNHGE